MLQDYSRYKLLQEFFDFPKKYFQIRELSRRIKLAQISITNHLKILLKENLIIKEKKHIYGAIRELHVYGKAEQIGKKPKNEIISQHRGLGKKLVKKAEEVYFKLTGKNKNFDTRTKKKGES